MIEKAIIAAAMCVVILAAFDAVGARFQGTFCKVEQAFLPVVVCQ